MKNWLHSNDCEEQTELELPLVRAHPYVRHPYGNAHSTTSPTEYALEQARLRLALTALIFILGYGVIAARLIDLAISGNERELVVSSVEAREGTLPVSRADIVDRNGMVLATSLPMYALCADTRRVMDAGATAHKLVTVLPDLNLQKVTADLRGDGRCVPLRRRVTPQQYYEINRLGLAGLEFTRDEGRAWPNGRLAAHIIGFTDVDGIGTAGIEKGQNELLQNRPQPLRLTIDLRLQGVLRNEINAAIREFSALGGAGIIMDANNGEVLALTSLPDFEPQDAGTADDEARFNRATLGVYEMGSTFKIFNTALAFESGMIHPADRFDTVSELKVGGRRIRDFHPVKYNLNVVEIFEESSNVGSARMAVEVGEKRQREFLARLGLLNKNNSIGLPEMGAPLAPSAANWGEATTMTVAFGHGVAVNALQMVAAVASIVNGGRRVYPRLIIGEDQAIVEGERVVSPETAEKLRAMMRLVVTKGTAKAASVPGYMVGGKTGTADKTNSGGRGYDSKARLSSFVGIFPADAPRYVVFVMLDDPKGTAATYGFATGGWTAAPAVARVIGQTAAILGIPPLEASVEAATEARLIQSLGVAGE